MISCRTTKLQFVLAHEIAHVDLEHCNRKLTYAAGRTSDLTAPAIGGFVGVLHNIMSRPYAKTEEFDADAYALRAVVAAGQTPSRRSAFPKQLGEYMKRKDVSHTRSPRETSVFSDIFADPPKIISARIRRWTSASRVWKPWKSTTDTAP